MSDLAIGAWRPSISSDWNKQTASTPPDTYRVRFPYDTGERTRILVAVQEFAKRQNLNLAQTTLLQAVLTGVVTHEKVRIPQMLVTENNTIGLVWWPDDKHQVEAEIVSENSIDAVVTRDGVDTCVDFAGDLPGLELAVQNAYGIQR